MDDQRAWPDAWPLDGWERLANTGGLKAYLLRTERAWYYTAQLITHDSWVFFSARVGQELMEVLNGDPYAYGVVVLRGNLSPLDLMCIVHDRIEKDKRKNEQA